jgi:hypothetical protein
MTLFRPSIRFGSSGQSPNLSPRTLALLTSTAWGFLALVHEIQVGVYEDLPGELGYDTVPWQG